MNPRVTGTPLDRIAVEDQPGNTLLVTDLAATLVLVLVLAGAVLTPEGAGTIAAVVSLVLFALGCGLFLWAYGLAVQRSRTEAIGIGGLFFLAGTAPVAERSGASTRSRSRASLACCARLSMRRASLTSMRSTCRR